MSGLDGMVPSELACLDEREPERMLAATATVDDEVDGFLCNERTAVRSLLSKSLERPVVGKVVRRPTARLDIGVRGVRCVRCGSISGLDGAASESA